MSKLWGRPITDPTIDELTYHQLLLYQALINKDIDQQSKTQREIVEYGVAFTKPEVLMKVLKEREQKKGMSLQDNDDLFLKQVSTHFDKPIDIPNSKGSGEVEKDIIRPLDLNG